MTLLQQVGTSSQPSLAGVWLGAKAGRSRRGLSISLQRASKAAVASMICSSRSVCGTDVFLFFRGAEKELSCALLSLESGREGYSGSSSVSDSVCTAVSPDQRLSCSFGLSYALILPWFQGE